MTIDTECFKNCLTAAGNQINSSNFSSVDMYNAINKIIPVFVETEGIISMCTEIMQKIESQIKLLKFGAENFADGDKKKIPNFFLCLMILSRFIFEHITDIKKIINDSTELERATIQIINADSELATKLIIFVICDAICRYEDIKCEELKYLSESSDHIISLTELFEQSYDEIWGLIMTTVNGLKKLFVKIEELSCWKKCFCCKSK